MRPQDILVPPSVSEMRRRAAQAPRPSRTAKLAQAEADDAPKRCTVCGQDKARSLFYKSGPYRKGACKKCMKDARAGHPRDWKARDLERKRATDAAYKKRRRQTEQGYAEEKAHAKRQMADPIKYEAKKARMRAYYRERKARGIMPSSNAAAKSRRIALTWQRVADHKAAHGCRECGERNPLVLDLHHRHPQEKAFTIGQHLNRAWSVLEAEIAKCDVLCCNCHQKGHRDRSSS